TCYVYYQLSNDRRTIDYSKLFLELVKSVPTLTSVVKTVDMAEYEVEGVTKTPTVYDSTSDKLFVTNEAFTWLIAEAKKTSVELANSITMKIKNATQPQKTSPKAPHTTHVT